MQSKTSFFNRTVFRKNLTRFAPVWGLFTLVLALGALMGHYNLNSDYDQLFYKIDQMAEFSKYSALLTCGYAFLAAQALFGDLFNTRSCYALHSMPLRRETLYGSHVLSGLFFGIFPALVMTLCAIPMSMGSCVVNAWLVPVLTFLASVLQYLFFFGVALFAVFCAGNRLGMTVIYAGINFGVVVTGLLVETIYLPLLFGVRIDTQRYLPYSPVAQMTQVDMVTFDDYWRLRDAWRLGGEQGQLRVNFHLVPDAWSYYAICAAVGIGLMLLGLWLYKKRDLECAGDFLAFKVLRPVFLVLFTFGMGAGFQLIYVNFSSIENYGYFIFMAVGLAVGWFGGKMMLDRTTRVFRKKNIPGLLGVALAVALSLGLTWLDPFDVSGWMPEADEVESIGLGEYNYFNYASEDPQEIADLMRLHRLALEQHLDDKAREQIRLENRDVAVGEERTVTNAELTYRMKNGKTVIRDYYVFVDSEAGRIVKKYYSHPKMILPLSEHFHIEEATELYIEGVTFKEYTTPEDFRSLWSALLADCEEGNMADMSYYHTGAFENIEPKYYHGSNEVVPAQPSISFEIRTPSDYTWVRVWGDSAHTIKWMNDRGILDTLGLKLVEQMKKPAVG